MDDPYEARVMCTHRDARAAQVFHLADGTIARPFYLYNIDLPSDTEPVQFIGQVYQEITWQGLDDEGYRAAELAVVHFNMTADHPQFGKLTITHDTSRPGTGATLRSLRPQEKFPVIHSTRLHVTAVSSLLPGTILQNAGPPLEFRSEPLTSWPPEETIYKLRTWVHFEDRRNPGRVFVTASDGAVLVGGL